MKNSKLLQEELNKFRLLSNYDTKKTLSENKIITEANGYDPFEEETIDTTTRVLKGNDEKKKGEVNFQGNYGGTITYAIFQNKGMFPEVSNEQWLGLRGISNATLAGLNTPPPSDETPKPKEPEDIAIPIEIKVSVEDPFVFDTVTLTTEAETSLVSFMDQIKNVKTTQGDEVYNKYIQFLKDSQPISIYAYASKDADPSQKISGKYSACKGYGKGTRGEYNLCLSQKRAEYILSRLETEFPELAGVFKAEGKGESTEFSGKGWPNSKNTEETKQDRRFVVNLPAFSDVTKTEVITKDETEKEDSNYVDGEFVGINKKTGKWWLSMTYPNLPKDLYLNYKTSKDGFIVVSQKELDEKFYDAPSYFASIQGNEINGAVVAEVELTRSGVKLKTQNSEMNWDNWIEATEAREFDSTALYQTNTIAAVYRFETNNLGEVEVYIKGNAFTISTVPTPKTK